MWWEQLDLSGLGEFAMNAPRPVPTLKREDGLDLANYQQKDPIGQGSYGQVYK